MSETSSSTSISSENNNKVILQSLLSDDNASNVSYSSLSPSDQTVDSSSSSSSPTTPTSSWFSRFRNSTASAVFVVAFAQFVDMLVYAIVIPVLPAYCEDHLHITSSVVGVLFASYAIGLLVSTPIFGILSDKFASRRLPMLIGLAALFLSTLLFGFATELWQLFISRICQGISGAATFAIGMALLADIVPHQELEKEMGQIMALGSIGLLIGPTVGGVMYHHVSYLSVFLLCAALVALDFVFRIVLINEDMVLRRKQELHELMKQQQQQQQQQQRLQAEADADEAKKAHDLEANQGTHASATVNHVDAPPSKAGKLNLLTMLVDPELMVSISGVSVSSAVFTAMEPLIPLHFQDEFGASSQTVGLSFLVVILPYFFFTPVVATLLEKYHKKVVLGAGILCLVPSLVAFPFAPTLYTALPVMGVFGLALGVAFTPALPEVAEYLSHTGNSHAFAQGYALFNFAYSLGMVIGPSIASWLYQEFGFRVAVHTLAGLCLFTGLFVFLYGAKHQGIRKNVPVVENEKTNLLLDQPSSESTSS